MTIVLRQQYHVLLEMSLVTTSLRIFYLKVLIGSDLFLMYENNTGFCA